MFAPRSLLLPGSCLLLVMVLLLALERDLQSKNPSASSSARLREWRASTTDLEIGGELAGLPPGSTRYVGREDLLALPQVSYTIDDDPNFSGPTKVKGVLLEDLPRSLGAASTANLVLAICDDKYRANYPEPYPARHHPLLVLEITGQPPSRWPKDPSGGTFGMGPYMISHARFVPSFKILSYSDEAQIPWGVVRLEFRNAVSVFSAISPRRAQNDADVDQGYQIAQRNCFRCHNMGTEGGEKSGVPWPALAAAAAGSSEWLSAYVRDPKSKNSRTEMPANPGYDEVTMRALVSYFRTFSETPAGN